LLVAIPAGWSENTSPTKIYANVTDGRMLNRISFRKFLQWIEIGSESQVIYASRRGLAFFVILGYGEVGNSQTCYCNAEVPFETASLVRQLLARVVLGS
jgi:hypothetical protein